MIDKKIQEYDAAIIGGGVIGAAVARELSRYPLQICLLEKEEDVCSGTSKANSAIIHGGFDAKPGSMKARMNVEGNRMMDSLAKELDIDFRRNGSMVVCFDKEGVAGLEKLLQQGIANGVEGLVILNREEAIAKEPNLSDEVYAALWVPSGGIVCPFGMTIALAENACDNGVEFRFNTQVNAILKEADSYLLETSNGSIRAKYVVNAAGVYADFMHNQVSGQKLHITPRRGSYYLLDKTAGSHVDATIFQLPGKFGKGILVTPTVHGNLLVGPTAVDIEDKENTATTAAELSDISMKAAQSVKNIPFNTVITSFAGLRAREDGDDFVLGEAADAEGFFDAAGIESPGLSSAPAIGKYLAELIAKKAGVTVRSDFNPIRKGIVKAAQLSKEERAELIRKNPAYGNIVCRCEEISEGEIEDAITRTLGARSLDGIKRRVRAGMGRCQAGFCTPRTMELLAAAQKKSVAEICKNADGSELLLKEETKRGCES